MMAEELIFDDSQEELVFDDRVEVVNVKPLQLDFTLSTDSINDEEELTLTAIGDDADNFVWFDAEEDVVIGRGNPLTLVYKAGVGLRSIKLRASSDVSKLFGVVTKHHCLTVSIKEVDDFFDRVDAEIAATGGSYQEYEVNALNRFCFFMKKLNSEMLTTSLFHPCISNNINVAGMSLIDGSLNGRPSDFDIKWFNNPIVQNGYVQTNGIDQYGQIPTFTGYYTMRRVAGQAVALFYYLEHDSDFYDCEGYNVNGGARLYLGLNWNGTPGQLYLTMANGVNLVKVPSSFDGQNYGAICVLGTSKANGYNDHDRTSIYCYSDLTVDQLIGDGDEGRFFNLFANTIRGATTVGGFGSFTNESNPEPPVFYSKVKWCGRFLSPEEIDTDEWVKVAQAWEQFHVEMGRSPYM